MTGRPGYWTMEMVGGSSAPYLARTPCAPLFCALFNRGGNRRASRLPGEGGDHFHCTVEPSPGHIRCRLIQVFIDKQEHLVLKIQTLRVENPPTCYSALRPDPEFPWNNAEKYHPRRNSGTQKNTENWHSFCILGVPSDTKLLLTKIIILK